MKRPLRIAVADDEPVMGEYYQTILPMLGHEVVAVAQTGSDLINQCRVLKPDLVITDIKMSDMDGIEAAEQICREYPIPIILVSAYHDVELIERASLDYILAYLVKPIKQVDLEPAISLAMRRFEQFQALHKEAVNLRQALEDRKLIERAKGILMKKGWDEESAFQLMQKQAMDNNQKLAHVARIIIAAEAIATPPEKK
jgi:AmiR/NasT family two-component response regulator